MGILEYCIFMLKLLFVYVIVALVGKCFCAGYF